MTAALRKSRALSLYPSRDHEKAVIPGIYPTSFRVLHTSAIIGIVKDQSKRMEDVNIYIISTLFNLLKSYGYDAGYLKSSPHEIFGLSQNLLIFSPIVQSV